MVIKQLIYVAALAREKHFGRAAKSCNVSQPTLSAAVRQLEDELGVPIVERGQRFQGLTQEGVRVLEYAKRIVADCAALKQDLGRLKEGLVGQLRFGVIPTALPMVSLITAPFRKKFPLVTMAVLSRSSIEIQRGIENFELEAGLTYLDNEPLEHVNTVPLYREEYILLAPSSNPLASRENVTWAEAAGQPLCLLTPDMQNRRIIDGVFRSVGKQPIPVVETNAIFNLWSYVSSGHGSSVVPKVLLQIFGVPAGTQALTLVEPNVSRAVGLVIADREPPSPLARGLFSVCRTFDLESSPSRRHERRALAS
jgi:DNA-binding transcriptional LysR family regulator